jgi:hypothetical protein
LTEVCWVNIILAVTKLKAWVLMVIGAGLVFAGAATAVSRRSFARAATSATGVVTRLNAGGSHPEIEFTTASGTKVTYPQGGLIFGYRPGQEVRVLYNPQDPAKTACVATFGVLWFVPLMLSGIGITLVTGGTASLRSHRRAICPCG